jgi:Rha family phage regulatory protein
MNQLVFIENNQAVTDSLTVAEVFGKRHDNVISDIENQITKLKEAGEEEFSLLNFKESSYTNERGRQYRKINMTEDAFTLIAMSYVTPEAMKFKIKFINEFKRMREELIKQNQPKTQIEMLAMMAQQMVEQEKLNAARDQKLNDLQGSVQTLTIGLTAVPDHTKVVERVNEYARYTRQDYNAIYNGIYKIMKAQHGIDVKARVENERRKINAEHYEKTGKLYAESTLKSKVNGIDVMVRMGVLEKFNTILVGLLAKAKGIE